ncbi:Amino acid/polyamine transporter I [Artemisia annua]|uniref:Amino acid/polyamine transporter I n=1 Tax=Artemisia annua TaxID=35608 RepID=A0A2U1KYJ7_ARTAN|nr:Amino acid/polyamine transporter I [Artemisia annua]
MNDPSSATTLPVTNPIITAVAKQRTQLTTIPLIFIIYFEVAGGPYGEEPVVKAAGPFFAILGFMIFPLIWCVPEALVTAELSTSLPGNGGYIIWTHKAFGPFWGSLMGSWKFLTSVINLAAFPILCVNYLEKLFPVFSSGLPRILAILISHVVLGFINFTGLNIVGFAAIALGVVSLLPFSIMSAMAIPHVKPHRWLNMGQMGIEKDWNLYLNTLFWNLNFWDTVSTMAGEVKKPKKTFPRALLCAVLMTCICYIVPLLAITGAIELDQTQWDSGYMAVAAQMIGGEWLKIFLNIGSVLSSIGLYLALLSSCAYQILGMAEHGCLPKFFEVRAKKFHTPWVGILVTVIFTMSFSFMQFTDIISAANFLYSLSMLEEFAAFIWLRVKFPNLKRPYRVPLGVKSLVVMSLVPSSFLILIMVIAKKTVLLVSGSMTIGAIGWYFLMEFCKKKKWFTYRNGDEIEVGEEEDNRTSEAT